jgi:hypothetical protein
MWHAHRIARTLIKTFAKRGRPHMKCLRKLKALLRKAAARTLEALIKAIAQASQSSNHKNAPTTSQIQDIATHRENALASSAVVRAGGKPLGWRAKNRIDMLQPLKMQISNEGARLAPTPPAAPFTAHISGRGRISTWRQQPKREPGQYIAARRLGSRNASRKLCRLLG